MPQAIGVLISSIIGVAIGAFIVALIVQLVCKLVVKFKPPYFMAYKAVFLGHVVSLLISFATSFIIGISGQQFNSTITLQFFIIGFFVQAAFYAFLIKHPEKGSIGFGKACLVSLIHLIFGALFMGTIALVLMPFL